MAPSDLKTKIEKIRNTIRDHDYRYYVLDQPSVSDEVYDKLFREFMELEAKHPKFADPLSPTQKVGGKPLDKFSKSISTAK